MASQCVVLVTVTLSVFLGSGYSAPLALCDLNPMDPEPPVPVTPSPPLAPRYSQNIEQPAAGTTVPYVFDGEEVFVPVVPYYSSYGPIPAAYPAPFPPGYPAPAAYPAPATYSAPAPFPAPAPEPEPCEKPLPQITPLSFALPTPPPQSPVYSFLAQSGNAADPSAALSMVAKILSSSLPPCIQAAASAAPPPPQPCPPAPAPVPVPVPVPAPAACNPPPEPTALPTYQQSLKLLPQSISLTPLVTTTTTSADSNPVDIATLLKLGLLQIQPNGAGGNVLVQSPSVTTYDSNAFLQPTAFAYDQTNTLPLGAYPTPIVPLSGLSPEALAQLSMSAVPPTIPGSIYSASAPLPEGHVCDENSKIGLIKNSWSKLYDPLRNLRKHNQY